MIKSAFHTTLMCKEDLKQNYLYLQNSLSDGDLCNRVVSEFVFEFRVVSEVIGFSKCDWKKNQYDTNPKFLKNGN